MQGSKGYIRARRGDPFLAHTPIPPKAHQGADPATYREAALPGNPADRHDERTRAFYAWLRTRRDLKAILCGHTHYAEIDDFSETAKMYVAGGNYEGRAYEITFT